MLKQYRAVIHASELLTGEGIRAKSGRHVVEADLGRISDGAIVYSVRMSDGIEVPDQVVWVGATGALPAEYRSIPTRDLEGKRAVIPGLIDCHTHLVFAGNRADEFALRCGGATYEEIALMGGGINSSVRATRAASIEELEALACERLREAWSFGVRALEIKSGYGLSLEAELKVLEVIPRLRKKFPQMTLTATFLGAHAFPPDQSREDYLQDIIERMLPEVARRGLADTCDVFIDAGYYTVEEGRKILTAAKALGLKTKVHADELANTESSTLAAELGCLSADHLLKISDAGIAALAKSETVAVCLPATAFYLKAPHAPARKLLDAGARVALSTDFNPGTSMTLNLPLVLTMGALYLGMSRAELLASVTYTAARALGLEARKGSLVAGMDADFTVLPFSTFEETYYRFGWAPPHD
ncbi:MAG: imidazolonepropionase [Methylotenera sp.]|nr:imidazolonepropionase [Oligoflexia bacterium]